MSISSPWPGKTGRESTLPPGPSAVSMCCGPCPSWARWTQRWWLTKGPSPWKTRLYSRRGSWRLKKRRKYFPATQERLSGFFPPRSMCRWQLPWPQRGQRTQSFPLSACLGWRGMTTRSPRRSTGWRQWWISIPAPAPSRGGAWWRCCGIWFRRLYFKNNLKMRLLFDGYLSILNIG